jgi:hypothetical protein
MSEVSEVKFINPFKPGAGHMPPFLAGREVEKNEFRRLLKQDTILVNMVLTGLRGVGKTVLLETFKPIAIKEGWLWIGTDLSESASINEQALAIRLLTDLSVVTSNIVIQEKEIPTMGFAVTPETAQIKLNFPVLESIYKETPGLVIDKLKNVLLIVWNCLQNSGKRGIIFAYDEAQNLSDQDSKEQYPLSIMLDLFQSIQKQNVSFLLILTGLPTLFPKLVDARTYAERMFHVLFLKKLDPKDSRDAILKPIEETGCKMKFADESVETIIKISGGYPYFIQFICREVYDIWMQQIEAGQKPAVPIEELLRKLDTDFFSGRWAKATDRQRELLSVIAHLENCDEEFTVQEVADKSKEIGKKPFSGSHINQMLSSLSATGFVYKNRFGKYSFAVPLLGKFILRQSEGESM